MKILVFGAGVLGCNLARNLFRAGKDVTLLARGNWANEIKTNGLKIKNRFSPCMSVSRIPAVTELNPTDAYDVVFVAVRYTQIEAILDTLRASRAKTILFVGNNVRASQTAALLPEKNVLFAFASAAGHRESDHVDSVDLRKITVGPLRDAPSQEALIKRPKAASFSFRPRHRRKGTVSSFSFAFSFPASLLSPHSVGVSFSLCIIVKQN